MNTNRLFKLDPRLLACSKFIAKNAKIADIGTDHAYLPIWLLKKNLIHSAIASDLRPGPLLNAVNNIKKHNLLGQIETRLSDGLKNILPEEVDTVVIAGMGGEVIVKILKDANWLKDPSKTLVLQPMSNDEFLRNFLKSENFEIKEETAVLSYGKIYSALKAVFSQQKFTVDPLYEFIGKIGDDYSEETKIYINKKIHSLKNKLLGLGEPIHQQEYQRISVAIKDLERFLERTQK